MYKMNKKILIGSILVIFLMMTISLTTVSSIDNKSKTNKRDSPLFKIRTRKYKIENVEDIKSNYLSGRIFLIFHFRNTNLDFTLRERLNNKEIFTTQVSCGVPTCYGRCLLNN